jgi:N4-gp56 family major capsid protein
MAVIGVTETSAVGLSVVSQYVQSVLANKSVLLPSILDLSSEVELGAKSVSIGRSTSFTAESKAENTNYTSQVLTWSADALNLDKHEGVYVEAETISMLQSIVSQESKILERATLALVEKMEANIYTALASCSAAAPDHNITFDSSTTLQIADIIEAVQLLDMQKVPREDRFLAVNPKQYWHIAGLSNFIEASKYGNNIALLSGEVGQILGLKVLMTNSVTVDKVLVYQREHVAFARQSQVTWQQAYKLANGSIEFLLQHIYGLKTLDLGKRGVIIESA